MPRARAPAARAWASPSSSASPARTAARWSFCPARAADSSRALRFRFPESRLQPLPGGGQRALVQPPGRRAQARVQHGDGLRFACAGSEFVLVRVRATQEIEDDVALADRMLDRVAENRLA